MKYSESSVIRASIIRILDYPNLVPQNWRLRNYYYVVHVHALRAYSMINTRARVRLRVLTVDMAERVVSTKRKRTVPSIENKVTTIKQLESSIIRVCALDRAL